MVLAHCLSVLVGLVVYRGQCAGLISRILHLTVMLGVGGSLRGYYRYARNSKTLSSDRVGDSLTPKTGTALILFQEDVKP